MKSSDSIFPAGPPEPLPPDADDRLLLLWAALGASADLGPALEERLAQQRRRLAQKAAASAQASRALVTTRYAPPAMARANAGARLQTLYLAAEGPLRPGEPLNVMLIELAPQASLQLDPPAAGVLREWLLVRGGVRLASAADPQVTLAPLDYRVDSVSESEPDGAAPTQLEADAQGALLFLRESRVPLDAAPPQGARTVRDADVPWTPYAPKIDRRVLWRHGRLAALLYRAAPGASVPPHGHDHDEECLMLRGETFLDEILLREADYQLAPAGTAHRSASTDTGSIFYVHGDLDLTLHAPADSV